MKYLLPIKEQLKVRLQRVLQYFLSYLTSVIAHCKLLPAESLPPLLKAFSASENISKIAAVKESFPGEISCFHGIR